MTNNIYFFLLFCLICSCNNNINSDTENTIPLVDTMLVVDSIHRIKLSFVGDIMGHANQIRSAAGNRENLRSRDMKDFNYEPCFRYVKPIFKQADLMIGNLELTLSNKGKYTGYPFFKTPDVFARYLKNAGFDILTTCNNHSNDGFLYGIEHTIDVLDTLGIIHTGTFKDQNERDSLYPLIVEKEVDGTTFKLAFLNYTYGTNGIPTPSPAIVNLIEKKQMLLDIATAKKAKPDLIIAIIHWGNEYWLNEHTSQVRTTKLLWENGVDVVIGAHPHVIEPIKTDTFWREDSTGFDEKIVAYSLGNFISNQYRPNTDIGLIFELELIKNSKTNQTVIGNHNYILVWRYIFGRYNRKLREGFDWTYTAVPVTAFENDPKTALLMNEREIEAMNSVSTKMRAHLGKWQSKERIVKLEELGTIVPLIIPHNEEQKIEKKEKSEKQDNKKEKGNKEENFESKKTTS
ncbi:MAG: CapA family protein [Saprospiraceae bacterium]|nr:CapA family protein [Saprospiraceae bacterium]